MQLSPQLFSRVASLLTPLPFVERRSEPREGVRGTARMVRGGAGDEPARAGKPVLVYVQDLSPGGAGLLSAAPVDPGEQVVLVMEEVGWDGAPRGGGENEAVSIVCAAAYCRALARDLYGIGVQFLGPDPEAADDGTGAVSLTEFDSLILPEQPAEPCNTADAPPFA
jgi:hypothetical protein